MDVFDNTTGNQTTGNNETDMSFVNEELQVYMNAAAVVVMIFPAVFKLAGCICLFLSTRTHFQIRYVSLSFLLALLAFDVCIISLRTASIIFANQYEILQELCTIVSVLFISITWSSLAHLAIDRLVLITRDTHDYSSNSKLTFVLTIVIIDWLLPVTVILGVYAYLYDPCIFTQQFDRLCATSVLVRKLLLIPYALYNGITIFVYLVLRRFLQIQESRRPMDSPRLSSARMVISVIIASLLMQSPYFLQIFVYDMVGFKLKWYLPIRILTSLLVLISMIVNTHLCVWKLDECQYHFLRLFLSYFDKYKRRADLLRVQVYGRNREMHL